MSSKVVQVKSHVIDPDFPSHKLAYKKLKYLKSVSPSRVLFKIITPSQNYIEMCKSHELDYNVICLNRNDVLWHEKDWTAVNDEPEAEVSNSSYQNTHKTVDTHLACYSTVKRGRKVQI